MKVCSKCKLPKPLAAFYKQVATRDGRRSQCKGCTNDYAKTYRKGHEETIRVYQLTYYREHREEYRRHNARWYEVHAAESRAHARRYYKEHTESCRARNACWCKDHAEARRKYKARRRKEHPELSRGRDRRRRARKCAVSENFTGKMEQLVRATWNNQCAFCGETENLQIDHWKPLSKGHALTMDNAVLLCCTCNTRKGARLPKKLNDQELVVAVEQRLADQAQQWLARGLVADFFAI